MKVTSTRIIEIITRLKGKNLQRYNDLDGEPQLDTTLPSLRHFLGTLLDKIVWIDGISTDEEVALASAIEILGELK